MPNNYRGTGGTLAGLGEFLQSLADANDPDKRKREALERQLATDPDLAYKLQQNPQQLQGLVGNKPLFGTNKAQELIDSVSSTPLTSKQSALKAVQDFQNQNANNAAKSGVDATNAISAGVGVGVGNIPKTQVKAPTTQQQDIYNRLNGLPTAQEQKTADLVQQHAQAEVAKDVADNAEKTQLRKLEATTRDYLAKNKLDPYNAFLHMASLPPEVQQGLTSAPSLQEAVKNGMSQAQFDRMYELQKLAISSRHNQDTLLQAAQVQAAQSLAEKLGNVPVQDILTLQKTPGLIEQITRDPTGQPPNLVNAVKALNDFSGRYATAQIQKAKSLYESKKQEVLNEVATGKQKNPQIAIDGLNEFAQTTFGQYGMAAPQITYDPKKWQPFRKPTITYTFAGDPRLGYKKEEDPTNMNTAKPGEVSVNTSGAPSYKLQDYQSMIDNGADYVTTRNDPRIPAAIRQQLKPAKKN